MFEGRERVAASTTAADDESTRRLTCSHLGLLQVTRIISELLDYVIVKAVQSDRLQRENVAINDVLSLKATRRDAIADLKSVLGLRDTNDQNSMVSFKFTLQRHLIRLASAPFIFSSLAKFGWVLCATPGNEAERRIDGG